ncbi:hypothetical protein QMK33_11595 [Hymenobacter sp. H14-R3]|uniref:hypothetical protein n=1 Tax=Hymenobacter sp. H14-R3 TaxID=3046308 RepID=UPI0024BAFBEB|nr:hypothetical protein [Hymenobacter sp. H14-R3]MDJ0365797.1 hypothetical protein [Hymenobacter sp. H14-R3]
MKFTKQYAANYSPRPLNAGVPGNIWHAASTLRAPAHTYFMHPSATLPERHTWARDATFRLKVLLLTGWRQLQNLRRPVPRFRA